MSVRTHVTTLALLALAAAGASAQTKPAAAPKGEFTTGSYYAGPRVWLGNLNGAVAIGGQIERGLTERGKYGPGIIAGGVGVDYYTWNSSFTGGKYSYSVVPLQAFSNYHFDVSSNRRVDPYLGLALVYSVVNASYSGAGGSVGAEASSFDIAGQAGARYFVSEKFAVQGQIGFGYGTLGLGATWRF